MGTLLLSAGIPMITAGDEFGRTQRGNNNAYCHDSPLTWMPWEHAAWQEDLFAHVRTLIRLRQENPALRPSRFARQDEHTPSASVMDWYDENGETMSIERWTNPAHRTLQYVATSTPQDEASNRVLLMIHGTERPIEVTLPRIDGVDRFVSLWASEEEAPTRERVSYAPGDVVRLPGTAMHLFLAE
jgi:glycogen operon protein